METSILIMAAGIGSRFGTGIKQLEPVDDSGHIIMDYSIHDAIGAGFNHVVFIIRKPWFWKTSDASAENAGSSKAEAKTFSGYSSLNRSTAPCHFLLSSEADEQFR